MTKQQYSRASKVAYIIVMAMMAYMAFTFIGAIAIDGTKTSVVIQAIVVLLAIAVTTFGYVTQRETKAGSIIIMLAPSTAYFISVCVNHTATTFLYAFPIMFASFVYLNRRMMLVGDTLVVIGTLIHIMRLVPAGTIDTAFAFVEGMITVLCVLASALSVSVISSFNQESLCEIEEHANGQIKKAQGMTTAAENLMKHFEDASTYISHVDECITTNNFSMENIAESTESTAEAIQQQATMCGEITNSTQSAEKEIQTMFHATENTLNTVNEGVTLVNNLKAQSEIVNEASKVTVQSTIELTKKISEVENITTAILSISSQTNLLALNASIEAARAGEAGKGFAVVAEEIRQLSEETKDSVNQITAIINELNENAQATSHSVEETISSVEKQAEMIDSSQEKFHAIADEVQALVGVVERTRGVMNEIFKDTGIISDSISHLSATSEEVAASSTEGLENSKEAVKSMNEVRRILESLNMIAEDLKSYAC